MGEHTKHSTSRVELRERIILAAVELFTTNGIKSITMDEIAASLGISKRTLYEVFPDKETLLEECILKSQKDGDIFVKGVIETSKRIGSFVEMLSVEHRAFSCHEQEVF